MWDINEVIDAARFYNLEEIYYNEESRVISFTDHNRQTRTNVYWTTRCVGTCLNHPRQGNTQLFRENCSFQELTDIMQNPRTHTRKGYKKRTNLLNNYNY